MTNLSELKEAMMLQIAPAIYNENTSYNLLTNRVVLYADLFIKAYQEHLNEELDEKDEEMAVMDQVEIKIVNEDDGEEIDEEMAQSLIDQFEIVHELPQRKLGNLKRAIAQLNKELRVLDFDMDEFVNLYHIFD